MKLSKKTKARIKLAILTACAFMCMVATVLAGPPTHG